MLSPKLSAGDICTREVVFALPGLAVEEAARLMREQHVGCLVVVDEPTPLEREVVGLRTDRDIVTAVVAAHRDAEALRVGDVMSRQPVTAREDDSLLDVLAAMRRHRVRRLPVVGPRNRLLGLVAIDDVLAVLAEQMRALADAVDAARRHEELAAR